jgi:uncharacterized protein YjaG (DUF416 family)
MMPVLKFSRYQLTRKLNRLPSMLRVVFSAACAERLLPAYITFSSLAGQGEPETLTRILARLWEDIAGDPMTGGEIQSNVGTCMGLIPPGDDEALHVETAYAEDASVAVVYALTCRQSGNSEEAMWSAQRACSAIEHFTTSREKFVPKPVSDPSRVYAHPLIQAELARQRRDLDELLRVADEDVREIAARFRDRAKAESKIFFGVPS